MTSILNLPAIYTISPFAHLDKVGYTLNVDGESVGTFATKALAIDFAVFCYGEE